MNQQPVDTLSYSASVAELEEIVKLMQSDKCDIDHLTDYTRRAAELLAHCRSRLTATQEQLRETLAALSNNQ